MDGPIDLVIFDLDGTLIDTAPEIAAATNDFLRHHGWMTVDADVVTRWIGSGTRSLLVEAIADASGRSTGDVRNSPDYHAYVETFDRYYDEHCGTISRPYPGVRETLASLADIGIRLAIVTNKEHRYTTRILEIHGLLGAFDPVISGDTLASKKPDPGGVIACLDAHNIDAEGTLFVGDSSIDARTARNAGVPVWLLPHGYNMGQPVAAAQADRIVPDFSEIERRLVYAAERPKAGKPRL